MNNEMNFEKCAKSDIEEIRKMNLWQKIHAVSTEVGRVQMTLNVDAGKGGKYKAASINDVVDSLLPMLGKYRLVVIPAEKEIVEQEQLVQKTQYGDKTQFYVRMLAHYEIVNIDKPEEKIRVSGYGDGIDSGDKCTGKADTYARKTALIDAFNLSRGDDPDREASKEYAPIEYAKPEQIARVKILYTDDEISTMLKRMKKTDLHVCTKEQVEKMIAKRDTSALNDDTPTF